MDKTTKLGQIFNAVETIGYLKTAVRIFQGINGQKIDNWRWVPIFVLIHLGDDLINYARQYPYIAHVLNQHQAQIMQIFADSDCLNNPQQLDQPHLTPYVQNLLQTNIFTPEAYQHSHDLWQQYFASFP